ncbi:MAG: DUF1559 domain-containing protein [Phycisphaerales bacterium JB063]
MKPRIHNLGFTLVELLVVLALIALMVALLLPALGRAREAGRQAKCLSNLRQMANATHAYLVDHAGAFPPAQYGDVNDPATPMYGWDFIHLPDGTTRPGTLWSGGGANEIQQCPSMAGQSNWGSDPYTGYNYNTSYLGGPTELWSNTPPDTANLAAVRSPSECAVFGDGEIVGGGANKFMRAPFKGPLDTDFFGNGNQVGGTQGYRHLGATNASFVDAHAEPFSTPHHETHPEALFSLTPDVGFLSPDNALYDLE